MTNFPNWTKNSPSSRKPSIQCKKKKKTTLTIWLLSGQQGHKRRLCFYTWIYFSFIKHAGFLPLCVLCLERAYLVFLIQMVLAEFCRSTSIIFYLSLSNAISYTHSFNDRVSNSDEIAFLTVLCRLGPS